MSLNQNTTMTSTPNYHTTTNEDDEKSFLLALQVVNTLTFPMAMQAIVELDVLDIIAKEGQGAKLSTTQITSHLPTKNPEAPAMLDRMMRLLACYNVFTCDLVTQEDGKVERLYGLAPVCKYFIKNGNGASFQPLLSLMHHKDIIQSWYTFKDAVLEGGVRMDKAFGMEAFEYYGSKPELNELFNSAQSAHTTIVTKKILEIYKGFEELKVLVDIGGGLGTMINSIITKYPTIKGINFDLPQVIEPAPSYPSVEHVGGDVFVSVPTGDAILMKFILHDWNDEDCVKILKNCHKALPENGKVIVVETVTPLLPKDDVGSRVPCMEDIIMLAQTSGGKERTKKEFKDLAMEAGFAEFIMFTIIGSWNLLSDYGDHIDCYLN